MPITARLLHSGTVLLSMRRGSAKPCLTQRAADDEVGAPPVAEDGHRVAEEAVQRLDHPRKGRETGQKCHLRMVTPFYFLQQPMLCMHPHGLCTSQCKRQWHQLHAEGF